MPDLERIRQLYQRFLDANASEQELAELFAEADKPGNQEIFMGLTSGTWDKMKLTDDAIKEIFAKNVLDQPEMVSAPPVQRIQFLKYRKWIAAASVLILIGGTVFYKLTNKKTSPSVVENPQFKNDVAPGGNKAILTLGNGKTIILDSAHNGLLAQQGNANIIKTDSGKLAYNILNEKSGTQPGEVQYNVLTTPMGGQFQLTLPDGSQVWLNAASSIKYPTVFTGKERNVEITGEAYFEVSKDKIKPFHVKVSDMDVAVLGTHFNINSYEDEGVIRTTLLEGSVKVTKNTTAVAASSDRQPQFLILAPGQQAQSDRQQQIKIVKDADLDQVMAWKNGIFNFNGSDLHAVMRQLGRWYDIKVEYEGSVPDIFFKGEMYRNVNLSDVLEGFRKMGVKFRLEKGKLVVTG